MKKADKLYVVARDASEKNKKVGINAVNELAQEKMTNEGLLYVVATTAKAKDVRIEAVKNIISEGLLCVVATKAAGEYKDVGIEAVNRLKEAQNWSANVAICAEEESVSDLAMKKLTDQHWLANVALCAANGSVRAAAIDKIDNALLLIHIVQNSKDNIVKGLARAKVQDVSNNDIIVDKDGELVESEDTGDIFIEIEDLLN
ncbi:MAG: hypothetical protein FWE86_04290 [Oscillospiraceae bacterium]|nr:hypothetical protein [Oscillospiraceae bacterium]